MVKPALPRRQVISLSGDGVDQAREHYRKARKGLDELAVRRAGKPPIHPQQIAKAISDHAAEDAVFTCDVGLPTVCGGRRHDRLRRQQT
jgi:pyruvate dehydrogenase (quinone)